MNAKIASRNRESGAERLNDLQAAFVRNVSHELRTPLTLIQGYVELLSEGELGDLAPQQQQAVYTVFNHVQELRTLVERISILTALEADEQISQPVALNNIVEKVVEARQSAAGAEQTLEVDLAADLPLLLGDAYHLEHVVDCLLENAYKFTPAGGQIKVRTWWEPGWVCLEVQDRGIGMTAEEIEKILSTDFYQVDGSTTRQYRGLGLGMTLVRAVVAKHGGRLEVQSRPGQGSTFTVRLPSATAETSAEGPEPPQRGAWRVLIVDDEPIVTMTLKEALSKIPNCQIATANDGQEALQLFQQHPFDLVITDYKMPGLDGISLARHVRQLYPQVLVILITAHGDHGLYEQAADAAVQRILNKPVGVIEIRGAVQEALGQSK